MDYFSYICGMKRCKVCNVELQGDTLMPHRGRKTREGTQAYRTTCKKCWNLRTKEYWKNEDGLWWVYLLKKENYVGQTQSWRKRKSNHKSAGRYIDDVEILHRVDTEEEAIRIESTYHDMGYDGRHIRAKKTPTN